MSLMEGVRGDREAGRGSTGVQNGRKKLFLAWFFYYTFFAPSVRVGRGANQHRGGGGGAHLLVSIHGYDQTIVGDVWLESKLITVKIDCYQ